MMSGIISLHILVPVECHKFQRLSIVADHLDHFMTIPLSCPCHLMTTAGVIMDQVTKVIPSHTGLLNQTVTLVYSGVFHNYQIQQRTFGMWWSRRYTR